MMQSEHGSSNSDVSNSSADNNPNPSTSSAPPDEKVLQDLSALSDQITLCQSMLNEAGTSIDSNEALLAVIGFLEACVPRMVELIEAAAQGALKEDTFEKCLLVNDRLTNTLADVDKDPKDRQPLTPVASASASSSSIGATDDDTDLLETSGGSKNINQTMGNLNITYGKTSGLESESGPKAPPSDPFAGGPELLDPTPPSNPFSIGDTIESAEEAPMKSNADDDDDFDAFFRDRTSASGAQSG